MNRKFAAVGAAMLSALSLAGCAAQTPEEYNAGRGAIIGGTTGALIGGLATGRPLGALAGAAIGAGSGAVVGAAATPRSLPPPPFYDGPGPGPAPRCARMGHDEYGEPVCLKLAGYPRS
jgi:osmotically inducible lipoprotein OsmB